MLLKSKNDIYVNSKLKLYRDGSYTLIRCDRKIFKPSEYCLHETNNKANVKNQFLLQDVKNYIDKHVYTFYDENGNPCEFWDVSKDEQFKRPVLKNDVRKDSLQRAKQSIFDIVYENDWKYFVTITFNGDEFSRSEPKVIIKKLQRWLKDRVQRNDLKYVLVPEFHKKGGIHCHALINDCNLTFVDSGTRLIKGYNKPVKLTTIEKKHLCEKVGILPEQLRVVYNIKDWKYGYSTAIETYGQASNLAFYITKYITKDIHKIFGKFFWSSKNIRRSPDTVLFNSDFDDNLSIVSPARANVAYQYDSSFSYQQVEQNCNDILQILKENGLD